MPPLARAAAIFVVVLVVAGVVVIAVRGTDPVAIGSPEPDQSSPPAATESADAPEPSPSSAADDFAVLAEIEAAVEALRGLPAAGIGAPDVIGRDELVAELQAIFEDEYPADERAADNLTLRAMGLLEPGQDIGELQLELLGDQVLGFYDDTEQRMVVVSDAGLNAEAKTTYAHEYTHALQDAAFGLASLGTDADADDDIAMARTALVEGDATLAMLGWALEGGLSQAELLELLGTQVPDTSGLPGWLVGVTEFPYLAGVDWALAISGGNPLAPDFEAIDAAYADPPTSTEQILHPLEKWVDREDPIEVTLPDLAGALGDGWEEVETTTVGEAWIAINFDFFEEPNADAAAAGWGGDRLVVASDGGDGFAMAWITAWDTPDDAAEFRAAYGGVIDGLGFPARLVELGDGSILVAHASDEALLAETVAAAGG